MLTKLVTERNRRYLDWIDTLPCLVCRGPATHHHESEKGGKGMGMKCSDYRSVPLCAKHHNSVHTMGKNSFYFMWGIDIEKTIGRLNQEWKKRQGQV